MPNTDNNLIVNFFSDLEQTSILLQMAVLAASFTLTWAIRRLLLARLPGRSEASRRKGALWVVAPLISLLFVLAGKAALRHFAHSVYLLDITIALLIALALIRLTLHSLHQVFSPSRWLSSCGHVAAAAIWLGFALHLTGLLPALLASVDDIGFAVGKQRISLLSVLSGILAVLVTMLLALWLSRTLEHRVMAAEKLSMNLRVVLTKLIRAALLVIGVLIALPLAGIDITVLSVFGGALGVGIGLGLQKIASNYVSGFVILLDRAIRLGDTLTVGGNSGKVTRISTRYLVLEASDGTEAIIPNETLISSTVINQSYTNRQARMSIPLQIGYRSDPERALEIMRQAAANQPRVLADPAPESFMKSFGANGIELELAFWINDPENGKLGLSSDINREIWREFQKAGIELPFPHREIRIVGAETKG